MHKVIASIFCLLVDVIIKTLNLIFIRFEMKVKRLFPHILNYYFLMLLWAFLLTLNLKVNKAVNSCL